MSLESHLERVVRGAVETLKEHAEFERETPVQRVNIARKR
jgi:hypothetical protein